MATTTHDLARGEILEHHHHDVGRERERRRQARLRHVAMVLAVPAAWLWMRMLAGHTIHWGWPSIGVGGDYLPAFVLVGALALVLVVPLLAAGRSPHVLYRSSEIEVGLDDVKGAGVVKEEVVKSLNLFLASATFREQMGGTPRRAILFEGPPGTGKTHMAKAMAREAGVPFLFVSSSAFQSMYYGQTNRKIRAYFRALRAFARREGGAIGFIEEIDAIGAARTGLGGSTQREGIAGVVNELLIQLQSFDEPQAATRLRNAVVGAVNRFLPADAQRPKRRPAPANVLVVGATNRAADLDPALLRPGRFDRSIHFGLPGRAARREIVDHYLGRKAHHHDLDRPERRDHLAAMTAGYSPVRIEHLLDEALVWALRRGAGAMEWVDVEQARMVEEIGLRDPVVYTDDDRRRIATHESGHAAVAWLLGRDRRLEVLSIVKRRDALGVLAHSDREERFTRSRSELEAQVAIALGGLVAEELWFGEASTGPASDLRDATEMAAAMVGSYGMGDSLVSWEAAEIATAGNLVAKVLADPSARSEVESLLGRRRDEVTAMLRANASVVEALRDALLCHDELVGEEIVAVIELAVGSSVDLRGSVVLD